MWFSSRALTELARAQWACGLSGWIWMMSRKMLSALSVSPWYTRLLARLSMNGGWPGWRVLARAKNAWAAPCSPINDRVVAIRSSTIGSSGWMRRVSRRAASARLTWPSLMYRRASWAQAAAWSRSSFTTDWKALKAVRRSLASRATRPTRKCAGTRSGCCSSACWQQSPAVSVSPRPRAVNPRCNRACCRESAGCEGPASVTLPPAPAAAAGRRSGYRPRRSCRHS